MSAYLQRLVRPQAAPGARPPLAAAAAASPGVPGLQVIESFAEAAPAPLAFSSGAHTTGQPPDNPLGHTPDPRDTGGLMAQVRRWVSEPSEPRGALQARAAATSLHAPGAAGPNPLSSDLRDASLPVRPQALAALLRGTAANPPQPSVPDAAALSHDTSAPGHSPATDSAPALSGLSNAAMGRAFTAPHAEATIPASTRRSQATSWPLPTHRTSTQSVTPPPGARILPPSRRGVSSGQVSVHVGTLELVVKPPPVAATLPAPAPPPAAIAPRGPSSDPMRFHAGRHHLRWS